MSDSAFIPLGALLLLLASAAVGAAVQPLLPEPHRSRDTTEAVRTAIVMVVTFAAVVLGLLTSSASDAFNQVDARLRGYATVLIQLDEGMREYGAEAAPLRQALRRYTAAAIADTWRQEPPPPGDDYPRNMPAGRPGDLENRKLGDMLQSIELALRRMDPTDPFHKGLAQENLNTADKLLDLRWQLIQSVQAGISLPFLAVLLLWLVVVFLCLGLSSPRNTLTYTITGLCAVMLVSAVFLLLELAYPFTGFITVSSAPLRDALQHMSQ